MTSSWLQIVQDAAKIPGLLVEIYGDLARPGVQQVGKALNTVLGFGNTILWPIYWTNERTRLYLEKNLQDYRERLAEIPQEEIVEVPPEIGVPIADKLPYARDVRLASLYVTLLATASHSDTVGNAHPSFVNVINNLAPDEAKLLENLQKRDHVVEFITAKAHNRTDRSFKILRDFVLAEEHINTLSFAPNLPAYIRNLEGLGLLEVARERTLKNNICPEIETHWRRENPTLIEVVEAKGEEIVFSHNSLITTEFGIKFVDACQITNIQR